MMSIQQQLKQPRQESDVDKIQSHAMQITKEQMREIEEVCA